MFIQYPSYYTIPKLEEDRLDNLQNYRVENEADEDNKLSFKNNWDYNNFNEGKGI